MDRCVEGVVAKGKPKDRAIAICHTSIVGSGSLLNFQAATREDVLALQASIDDVPTSEIWKFEGACLARAEVNANGDGVTDEGITQLASTIRLMPLTEEHDKQPRGIFTKGYTNEGSTECLVDGFVWAGHFPEFADEVRSGIRKLSMDAEASLAICGECGKPFTSAREYCEHIRNRSSGAVRWLYDLTAVAGGAVRYPAGTGTVFPGREGFTVISHNEAQVEWWRKHWDKESEIPASSFADKNRVYPFKGPGGKVDKEGWMAAWKHAHAHKATAAVNVLKRNLPAGYKLEGDHVVKGGMVMKIVCSECGHEHEVKTDAEQIQAELDAKLKELQELQSQAGVDRAKIDELQASITGLETKLEAEQKVVSRYTELASVAGVEFANEALESLREASDSVFETFKAMASKVGRSEEPGDEDPPERPDPETVVASDLGSSKKQPGDTWEIE
jgi:uncharacterized Zn finger protein (UPF0148 family)